MSAETATRVILNNYVPEGIPKPSDFIVETVAAPTENMLKENELLVRPLYLSCDPIVRIRMNGRSGNHIPCVELGAPIESLGVCAVEASTSNEFVPGDYITGGFFPWAQKSIVSAGMRQIIKDTKSVSLRDYLGVLGMPSFTAYVGLVTLSKPKAGETLLVSSAAGAVGQVVVQLAKARGLRVIGVAGSDDKVEFVKSIGADAAFNYKTCGDFEQAICQAAPEGVDIYFDNVGGEFLDATLMNMRPYGRIAACGLVSQYGLRVNEMYRLTNFIQVINRKLNIAGFSTKDYLATTSFEEFLAEVSALHAGGKITYRINDVAGLENGPAALIDVFAGATFGKHIINV